MAEADPFAAVRDALRQDNPLWQVQHIDITCDGCECEPIVGHRFKCCVCEDIDLCAACMRALVAARVKMSQEAGPTAAPPRQGGRPRRWVHKLHSKDLSAKWAALQTAVPCLHPSHRFAKVVSGPERAVVYLAGSSTDGSSGSEGKDGGSGSGAVDEASGPSSSSNGSAGLDQFLATFPPSAASCRDVAWIVVAHPGAEEGLPAPQQPQQQQQPPQQGQPQQSSGDGGRSGAAAGGGGTGKGLEERVDAAVEEWEKLTGSGKKPTAADVDRLAGKHNILKGKWMLFARSGAEADTVWAAVARAVCGEQQPPQQQGQQQGQEQLARQAPQPAEQEGPAEQAESTSGLAEPLCRSAKVSSASPDGSWVLCVYTDNYQDRGDVERVCRGLRRAVPPGALRDTRLLYKPDVYTYLGIYSRNEWQLKPTILEAALS